MKFIEPPSRSSAASVIVFIGRNRRGEWVAREHNGLFGGLFVNRAQGVKYALFENGHHPETIVELPREVEIDILSPAPQTTNVKRAAFESRPVSGVGENSCFPPAGSAVHKCNMQRE